MSPRDIIEGALRASELAASMNEEKIARDMLHLAALWLSHVGASGTRTGPQYVVTTDYRQSPCS